jgi:predicted  nucleic acid-binding Zn-ribbon protein
VKNAVLWLMLLACMGASVFFSFDSHFNAIFPTDQRKRAAEIRTLDQVAGLVADIGERARKAQIAEAQRLFESDGWKAYDAHLGHLALVARGALAEIEAAFVARMEAEQRGIGEQQERIAGAERSRTALLRKRDELEAELQRLEPSVGALEAELAKAQATLNETRQAIAAKRIEASAEDGGVEGSLKRGKGPVWRQRTAELDELQRKLAITDEPRLEAAQRRRDLASARIVSLKREIATIVAEVAKYQGTIATAEHRIKAARQGDGADGHLDPAHMLPAFERARADFRRRPDAETLAALRAQCGELLNALSDAVSAAPARMERMRGIDCDPRPAAEAAARVFGLNAGLVAFQANCAGGSRLPQTAGTDELLAFGRKCLQDSGLASKEAANLGARLQAIEMNRDDKAHRFVVTWNALLDGNRLAYLALALAIGVDSLVFMAGLFGAAAVRSPLSDVPNAKARSAEQLEAIVNSALGADRLANAELVLAAMKPAPGNDDHRLEVALEACDAGKAERIRRVLAAGASIGAVERTAAAAGEERYRVRPELFEFLSMVASAARDREHSGRPGPTRAFGGVPEPDRPRNAEIVSSSRPATRIGTTPVALAEAHAPPTSRAIAPPAPAEWHAPDMDDLHRHFWDVLLQEMKSEALTVAEELERQGEAHGDLGAVLEWIARGSRRALGRAVRALESAHADDGQAKELLDEKRREIDRIVPALMLLPELGLLDILIAEVAKSGDEDLLKRLHNLGEAIEGMERVDDAASWRDIARRIRQLTA